MTPDDIWVYCKRKNYSVGMASYWQEHTRCEACKRKPSETPHHLRTRAAGGDDSGENLLALCIEDHSMFHAMGRSAFCKRFPHLKAKVDKAMARPRNG